MFNINLSNKPGLQGSDNQNKIDKNKNQIKDDSSTDIDMEKKEINNSHNYQQIIGYAFIILLVSFIIYDYNSENSIIKSYINKKEDSIVLSNSSALNILNLISEKNIYFSDDKSNIILEDYYLNPEKNEFLFRIGMIGADEEYYLLIDKIKNLELYSNLKLYNYNQKKYLEAKVKYNLEEHISNKIDLATLRMNINENFKDDIEDPEDLYMSELVNNQIVYKMNYLEDIYKIVSYLVINSESFGDYEIRVKVSNELALNNYNLTIE